MRFQILTFGCKVNQCDSAGLTQDLLGQGWQETPAEEPPQLVVVNTCTVTRRADQQARQAIHRLAREHPGAAIWVTGCYAQRTPEEPARLPGVGLVFGNRAKAAFAELLTASPTAGSPRIQVEPFSSPEPFSHRQLRRFPGHTRAWLKIQEGCDHICSYCIVPSVRGPARSLALPQVAEALTALGSAGFKEVVLTGINLGQYGLDLLPPLNLAVLLNSLTTRPWPFRLRLSSLEPQDLTPELLRSLAALPGLCPHFHIPLQSGSAAVLQAMHRDYRPQEVYEAIRQLYNYFPEAAVGLDILTGFPTETAADFETTYNLVAALPLAYLHVFPFSPRPGTPAAQLRPLAAAEVQQRAAALRRLGREKKRAFYQRHLGTRREVLVEGPAPAEGWLIGLSDNYLRVLLPAVAARPNQRLWVRCQTLSGEALLAEPWAEDAYG